MATTTEKLRQARNNAPAAFRGMANQAVRESEGRDRTEQAAEQFNSVLDMLRERAGSADKRAGLSSRDLFGDQIDRSTDIIRSGANQRKRALSGVNALRGGDVSGRLASNLSSVDQSENEALRNLIMGFEDRTLGVQEQALGRGDQLMNLILGGRGNMLQFRDARQARDQARRDQQKQASRQMGVDLFGGIINPLSLLFNNGLTKE